MSTSDYVALHRLADMLQRAAAPRYSDREELISAVALGLVLGLRAPEYAQGVLDQHDALLQTLGGETSFATVLKEPEVLERLIASAPVEFTP